MKPRISIVLFIVCLSLGALLLVQWRQLNEQKELIQTLQVQVEEMQGEINAAKSRAEDLAEDRQRLRGEILNLSSARGFAAVSAGAAATPPQAVDPGGQAQAAPASADGKGRQNPLTAIGDMMKDPEMRKVMAQQQQMALNMMYAPMYKKLGLTEEETEELKKLLLEQQMSHIEQSTALMDQGITNKTAIAEKLATEKAARDEQIKALLGEDRFTEYEDYTQTMGERMMLNQQMNLPEEKMEQLLSIMAEEKRAIQAFPQAPPDPAQNLDRMMQEGFLEQHLTAQEGVNAHVYERARAILTPEQLETFEAFQKNQLNMQRMGIEMARRMMKPGENPGPTAPTEVQR